MSENPFTDGQQFSSARLNSMYNAHQNNGVLTGLDGSVGANSFEVDVSAGEVFLNGSVVSTTATTVTHSTSDTEDRIDLITVDATGAVSITQGAPATTSGQPVAPDIPTDEVLAVLVYVRGGSTEILTGDILNDYKTTVGVRVPTGIITMWSGSVADIPDGWALCDGTNNTPDLQDRFVVGAGNQYTPGDTGGSDSVQLTISQIPSHTHEGQIRELTDDHSSAGLTRPDTGIDTYQTSSTGGDQAHENRPPFYALAYIQKL